MAASFDKETVSRSTQTYSALPEDIIILPHLSGRKDYSDLQALEIPQLAHSIVANGQRTPALCRMNNDGKPVLVYGRRRVLAADYANKNLRHLFKPNVTNIEVVFTYAKLNDQEALIAAISENSHRKDVNDMDHAHNIAEALKFMPVEKVALIYFPEALEGHAKANAIRWVRDRGSLPELVPELQEKVRSGEIKITEATKAAKLTPNEQHEVLKQPAKIVAGKPRITGAALKAVKGAKPGAKPAPKPPAKANREDDSVAFDVPEPKLAALPKETLARHAEVMARAIQAWMLDATEGPEKNLIAVYNEYRKDYPLALAEGRVA